MEQSTRSDSTVQNERALLITVVLPGSTADPRDPVGELRSLVKTAGARAVDEMIANRKFVHPGMYVGTGKAQEIADRAKQHKVDAVIFDNDLSPGQIRELEKVIDRKVIDRSELILDIFAAHARTNEARLQVEMAQLQYTFPRLRHMWTHLDRGAGSAASGGVGTRGPGEKQIETDRRLVRKRMRFLKGQVADIDKRKVRQVSARGDTFCVCLVGYTNAGKSTLMQRLTGCQTYIADQLFATLDTKTRKWDLGNGQATLLSDTVGFIRDLPHHLVASFRASLEEAIHADLLLHVADASNECLGQQISAVNKVLVELGCAEAKRLLVLNKLDCITDPTITTVLAQKYPDAMLVSAVTGEGVDALSSAVATRCAGETLSVTILADCTDGKLMQYISRHAKTQSCQYQDTTARIEATIPASRIVELESFGQAVTVIRNEGTDDSIAPPPGQ